MLGLFVAASVLLVTIWGGWQFFKGNGPKVGE